MSAGVIGWPVAHSKSPLIHRFWLGKLGLDGDYGRFAVHPDRLGEAIRALPALGLQGVNVTVPHKVTVMRYLDEVDAPASQAGAVNTVVAGSDGMLTGYNTDIEGFAEPLRNLDVQAGVNREAAAWRGPQYHVIGTGGAARAVAAALRDQPVTIYGRNLAAAQAIINGVVGSDTGRVSVLAALGSFDANPAAAASQRRQPDHRHTHILINASTLGMAGHPPLPLVLDGYPGNTIVYDLVYAPLETPLLATARALGMRTIDGLAMLIGQAAAAFMLLFGQPAPREHDAELRALLTA